jgi:pyruvate/2-oxoacid:ferredoxin oxidoreductase beta subunit
MTKDEALRLALEALEYPGPSWIEARQPAITAIKAALEANEFNPDWDTQAVLVEEIQRMAKRIEELEAKDEPVKVAHRHEWFRTGEMKVGQMRCISCGTWAEEEMPQRTWVGLTDEEAQKTFAEHNCDISTHLAGILARAIEAKLKEKNT